MVVADVNLALKSSSTLLRKSQSQYKNSSTQDLVAKLTHLYLQEKNIERIDDLSQCENVLVLYLQDNFIKKLENFGGLSNLTHLYLQNNCIERIENLEGLSNLIKLYVGGNAIAIVENLEALSKLRELHIENQQSLDGQQILFEPRTLRSLADTLLVLNVSNNNLETLNDVAGLRQLIELTASGNRISDLDETAELLTGLSNLVRLDLSQNPICRSPHYRKKLVPAANSLVTLDGKEISHTSRMFLLQLKAKNQERGSMNELSPSKSSAETEIVNANEINSGNSRFKSDEHFLARFPGPSTTLQSVQGKSDDTNESSDLSTPSSANIVGDNLDWIRLQERQAAQIIEKSLMKRMNY